MRERRDADRRYVIAIDRPLPCQRHVIDRPIAPSPDAEVNPSHTLPHTHAQMPAPAARRPLSGLQKVRLLFTGSPLPLGHPPGRPFRSVPGLTFLLSGGPSALQAFARPRPVQAALDPSRLPAPHPTRLPTPGLVGPGRLGRRARPEDGHEEDRAARESRGDARRRQRGHAGMVGGSDLAANDDDDDDGGGEVFLDDDDDEGGRRAARASSIGLDNDDARPVAAAAAADMSGGFPETGEPPSSASPLLGCRPRRRPSLAKGGKGGDSPSPALDDSKGRTEEESGRLFFLRSLARFACSWLGRPSTGRRHPSNPSGFGSIRLGRDDVPSSSSSPRARLGQDGRVQRTASRLLPSDPPRLVR